MEREIENRDCIIIKLQEENGVKFEEISEFSQSLFQDVYYEAFINTQKIIEHNNNYKDDHPWKHERMYNIIPFWGPRGMGKTSVMRSFLGALDKFNEEEFENFRISYQGQMDVGDKLFKADEWKNYEFVCLECIDASLLEEHEDIFEVILAKMLGEFLKKIRGFSSNEEWVVSNQREYFRYRKEDVISKFEKIYRDLQNIKAIGTRYGVGEGAVEILRDLSGSLDLRETFKELVPLYLKVMSKKEEAEKKRFLVISIDDIDMKLNGYNMLEQIHRYFMVPDVLIYITVSEAELLTMCNHHFCTKDDDVSTRKRNEKLAKSYIDKVLPSSNRLYMPVLSSRMDNIRVEPDLATIKEMILWKIARRTRVFFDGCGLKQHFYEPEDIRTLVNLWSTIEKLHVLNMDEEFNAAEYRVNINCILEDITNRLAVQKLNGEQKDTFTEISLISPERQGVAYIQRIIKILSDGKFSKDYEKYGYSYGELLRGLYTIGRERSEEKTLVHCILALETAQLTNLYIMSLKSSEDENRKRFKKRLKDCFGKSISGSWGNKLVPKVMFESSTGAASLMNHEEKKSHAVSWGYITGNYNLGDKEECIQYQGQSTRGVFETCKDALNNDDYKLVETLELMALFITRHQPMKENNKFFCKYEDGKKEEIEKKELENVEAGNGQAESTDQTNKEKAAQQQGDFSREELNQQEPALKIGFNSAKITFDILGFVINCMRYEEVLNDIDDQICNAFVKACNIGRDLELNELKEVIDNKSLKRLFKEWENSYGYLPLPAHSTDITYNVLKRVKRKCAAENTYIINESNLLKNLVETLKRIRDELKREDEFYGSLSSNRSKKSCDSKFEETFINCPIIKILLNQEYSLQFESLFNNFVKKLKQNEEILDNDDIIEMPDF